MNCGRPSGVPPHSSASAECWVSSWPAVALALHELSDLPNAVTLLGQSHHDRLILLSIPEIQNERGPDAPLVGNEREVLDFKVSNPNQRGFDRSSLAAAVDQ